MLSTVDEHSTQTSSDSSSRVRFSTPFCSGPDISMPTFKPHPSIDDGSRGRVRRAKCLFGRMVPVRTQEIRSEELEVIEEECFVADLEMDSKSEMNTPTQCSCGHITKPTVPGSENVSVSLEKTPFPPYLMVCSGESILVKGSTSQLIMQFLGENIPIAKIPRKLSKKLPTERYSTGEVQSVIRTCALRGLDGESPLATENWENEAIEGWWLKEDSYCEALRREQPVNEEVCGYKCEDGWWTGRERANHRDWDRWPCRSIGPENWRRQR